MSALDCQVSIPEVAGLEANQLTVGRHLILHCKAYDVANFAFDKAVLKTDENTVNTYKLFKAVVDSDGKVNLDLTFYKAGVHQLKSLILTDGVSELSLSGSDVKFESVLKAKEDGKPQDPFGPIAPLAISTPIEYFIFVLLVLITAVTVFAFRLRSLNYYKNLKLRLKKYQSPTSPDTEFYRTIRQAEKLDYPLQKVEDAFRLYVLRTYQLPMFDLTDQRIMRYFKRNFPEHKMARAQLNKLLGNFEVLRAKQNSEVSVDEKQELVKKLYRFVENSSEVNL